MLSIPYTSTLQYLPICMYEDVLFPFLSHSQSVKLKLRRVKKNKIARRRWENLSLIFISRNTNSGALAGKVFFSRFLFHSFLFSLRKLMGERIFYWKSFTLDIHTYIHTCIYPIYTTHTYKHISPFGLSGNGEEKPVSYIQGTLVCIKLLCIVIRGEKEQILDSEKRVVKPSSSLPMGRLQDYLWITLENMHLSCKT